MQQRNFAGNRGRRGDNSGRVSRGKRVRRWIFRRLICLAILWVGSAALVLGSAAYLQRGSDPTIDAPGLELLASQWSGPVHSRLDQTMRRISSISGLRRGRQVARDVDDAAKDLKVTERATTSITVKNTSGQEITYVEWECVLLKPDDSRGVLARLRFETDQQAKPIKPNERRQMERTFQFRQKLPDGTRSRFRLLRVRYADGSSWERQANERF